MLESYGSRDGVALAREQTPGSVEEQRGTVSRPAVSRGAKANREVSTDGVGTTGPAPAKREKILTFAVVELVYYTSGGGNAEGEATAGPLRGTRTSLLKTKTKTSCRVPKVGAACYVAGLLPRFSLSIESASAALSSSCPGGDAEPSDVPGLITPVWGLLLRADGRAK